MLLVVAGWLVVDVATRLLLVAAGLLVVEAATRLLLVAAELLVGWAAFLSLGSPIWKDLDKKM